LIKNFYRAVLNYFDAKTGQKTSSFEQLKLEAFRQLSIDQNFASFVKLEKKQQKLNRILTDLEVFRESSDGFRFVNNRDVQVFGFAKFREILKETDGFKATFEFPENTKIRTMAEFLCLTAVVFASEENPENLKKTHTLNQEQLQKSLLARNSIGQSFFHFLVDSGFQNSLLIEFLDLLKVHFGSDFVGKILKLKNNEGLTFWSHAFANKNISSFDEINFGSFLEEILKKLCRKKINFGDLKKLAFDLIFGRENFKRYFDVEFVSAGILSIVDGEVNFSDYSFFKYFALKGFHNFLKENSQNEKTFEFCGKLLSDRDNFSELCWLIEMFFAQNLNKTKKALLYFAGIGEEKETPLFLFLDILINQVEIRKNLKSNKNLLFENNDNRQTFLHKFCWNEKNWSEQSFKKFFNKLKELKKFIPDKEFKKIFMLRDILCRTFLHWLKKFDKLKIAFDFLHSEFEIDFVEEILLAGEYFFGIQFSIPEFSKALSLFKNNFDKEFVRTFLMQKSYCDENFLLRYDDYSNSDKCSDLLKLFDLIFSICGADFDLFDDLFYFRSRDGQTFFEKLEERYENENEELKLKLITDWIEKILGHDFLKKLVSIL
jgi:hypothetical protein